MGENTANDWAGEWRGREGGRNSSQESAVFARSLSNDLKKLTCSPLQTKTWRNIRIWRALTLKWRSFGLWNHASNISFLQNVDNFANARSMTGTWKWWWLCGDFFFFFFLGGAFLINQSPPALLLLLLKRQSARAYEFHSLRKDQSTVAQRAETTVAEHSLTSCAWARFPDKFPHYAWTEQSFQANWVFAWRPL